ncbi:MAG: hypothetical protein M3132_04965 [Actinomycetia bacterium]|nr:hypothetical protein [Actinomycetes bacterium]
MGGSTYPVADGAATRRLWKRSTRWLLVAVVAGFVTIATYQTNTAPATATGDTWVLSETRINPGNEQTEFVAGPGGTPKYFNEPRFEGKFQRYTITATSISSHNRDVDYELEHWNMTSQTSFDTPPSVLTPGEVVTLDASGSATGSALDPWTAGEQFEFRADGVTLEGESYFAITINSPTAPSSGSVSPQFTVPSPWSDDAEIVIKAFYWNCASCLVEWVYKADVAPPTTTSPPTTTRASTTTMAEPLACYLRGTVTDSGARPFGPPDRDGHALADVDISIILEGTRTKIAAAPTNRDGFFDILVVSDDLPAGFDIDKDKVQVLLTLRDVSHDPARFEIIDEALFQSDLRSDPIILGDECGTSGLVERNFRLGDIPDNYQPQSPDDPARWDDIAEIYHQIHKAIRLADLLDQDLDNENPLSVNVFASDFLDIEDEAAFWCGSYSNGERCSAMSAFIAFGDDATLLSDPGWPKNREYHEFGHHFLADAFANKAPKPTERVNHGGYYVNPSSSDSWVEAFAEFFAVMVSKHIDQEAFPAIYTDFDYLEWDYRPWLGAGEAEEFAIAGLLLDLEDGPEDYGRGRQLPELSVAWHDMYTDPALGTVIVGEVVNGSPLGTDYSEQTMVAAEFRQDGSVVQTVWAVTLPWDLPGDGGRGFFAAVVPPEVTWDSVELVAFEGRPGDVGTDDDPVDLTLQEVWDTIVVYTSTQPESNGYMFDVADLYTAFSSAYGGRDGDDNGMDDIDQIFVAHGFFGDSNGDRSFHTETPGMTDHPARAGFPEFIPRRNTPPLSGTMMTVDTGQIESRVIVQILLPDSPGYSYLATPDAQGRVHVSVPGTEAGGTVILGAVAAGYEPTIAGSFDIETFWADVEARGDDAAPTFAVNLVPEETAGGWTAAVWPLLLGIGGILLIVTSVLAGRGALRRRHEDA